MEFEIAYGQNSLTCPKEACVSEIKRFSRLHLIRWYSFNSILGGVCVPNPCHNRGSCVNLGETFECICKKGYTGKKCKGK